MQLQIGSNLGKGFIVITLTARRIDNPFRDALSAMWLSRQQAVLYAQNSNEPKCDVPVDRN